MKRARQANKNSPQPHPGESGCAARRPASTNMTAQEKTEYQEKAAEFQKPKLCATNCGSLRDRLGGPEISDLKFQI